MVRNRNIVVVLSLQFNSVVAVTVVHVVRVRVVGAHIVVMVAVVVVMLVVSAVVVMVMSIVVWRHTRVCLVIAGACERVIPFTALTLIRALLFHTLFVGASVFQRVNATTRGTLTASYALLLFPRSSIRTCVSLRVIHVSNEEVTYLID